MTRVIWAPTVVAGLFLLPACGDTVDPTSVVATLEIHPDSVHLDIGDSVTIRVSPLNADGALVSGVAVTFEMADPSVATVSAGGTVASVGRGTTSLTIRAANVSAQVSVVVVQTPAEILVTPDTLVLEVWEEAALTVVVTDGVGNEIPDASVEFTSSESSVALVFPTGLVRGVNPGTAIIIATVGAQTDSTPVEVIEVPGSIVMTPDSLTLQVGEQRALTVQVFDRQGRAMPDAHVTFRSSDYGVAWVSGGKAVGVSQGEALLTVNAGEVADTTAVEVTPSRLSSRIELDGGPWDGAVAVTGVAAIAMFSANELQLIDMSAPALLSAGIPMGKQPIQVAFSPDGATAYVSNLKDGTVRVVDVASRMAVKAIPVPGHPLPLGVSGDGQTLFVSTDHSHLYRIDLSNDAVVDSVRHFWEAHHMAFNEDRTLAYLPIPSHNRVVEIDLVTLAIVRTFVTGGASQGVAVSPDGSRLFVAIETDGVGLEVWDLVAGTRTRHVPLEGGGWGLATNGDASRVYVSVPSQGVVVGVDPEIGTVVDRVATGGEPRGVLYDAHSSSFLVANYAGSIDFFR